MSPESDWIARLTGDDGDRNAALAELRRLLGRNLAAAFKDAGSDFVDDVVQDAMLRILDKLDTFNHRSKFTTWATTIAVRVGYTELRRRQWKDVSLEQIVEQTGDDAITQTDTNPTPQAVLENRAVIEQLHLIIREKLTDRQRRALLAELGGMPQSEIGRLLGANRNAIYKLTHDARKRIKRELEELGYSAEDLRTMKGAS